MITKLFKWAMVTFLLSISSLLAAQTSVLNEDFETGMPTTWQVSPTGVATPWTVSASGITGVTAYGGTNYMSLYTTNQQAATKVELPMVNVAGLNEPEVSFYLMQKAHGANTGYARDTLKIYGRATATAQWALLSTFDAEVSSWTKKSVDLSAYTGNVQLAFEYNYGAGLGLGIDNIRIGAASVCYAPTNLREYRLTTNSVELTWDAHELAFAYGLKVSTTALSNPATSTADVFDNNVYAKPHVLTGLTPSTTYYYYVSADCGDGDVSAWSAQGQFTTRCNAVNVPFTEQFNGGTTSNFNSCWIKRFKAEGTWTTTPATVTYTPDVSGNQFYGTAGNSVKLYAYYYKYDNDLRWTSAWMTTPEINVTNMTTLQAHFYAYATNAADKLHVGVMSDPDDEASFEEVWEVNFTQASTWEEFTIPLSSITGSGKYIAFKVDAADRNATSTIYVDDVTIEIIPACPPASMIKANNITEASADVSWLGAPTSWNMKVSTTPLADPATGTGDIFSGTVTGNAKSLTGLTSGTSYYVYVQPDCSASGDGLGEWSDEYTFATKPGIVDAPFVCDFESTNDRNQWDFFDNSFVNVWRTGTAINNGGSYSLYVSNDNGVSNNYNSGISGFSMAAKYIRFTPGEYEISFDYKCIGESSYDYMYAFLAPSTLDLSTITIAGIPTGCTSFFNGTYKSEITTWTTETLVLSVNDTVVYSLVFQWRNDGTASHGHPAAIDNISIVGHNCLSPTTINVTNILQTSADAAWTTSILGETAWDVRLAATALDTNELGTLLDTTVNTPSVALTNLTASTTYYLYVRSNCGTEHGSWTLVNFMTACGDITSLPYIQTFSTKDNDSLPNCWTDVDAAGSMYNTNDVNKDNGFSMALDGLLATPYINVTGIPFSDMMLTFSGASVNATSDIVVGVITDITDTTSFVPTDTFTTIVGYWHEYVALFNGANIPAGCLAFKVQNSTATLTIIDDVRLIQKPTCLPVIDVTVDSVGVNDVILSWTDLGAATAWDIAVAPKGGHPDSVAFTTYNTNPAHITGLHDAQTYDIYVRNNCGSGSVSTWEGARVTTFAQPAEVPYVCDFETDSISNSWLIVSNSTNKFIIGNGTNNGGDQSLYVSANGTAYGFSEMLKTNTYAYRDISLEPGMYTISYDWTCVGEKDYWYGSRINYGAAYLAPIEEVGSFNTAVTLNAPSSWNNLTNGDLIDQSGWTTCTKNIMITTSGIYRLFFYWHNDYYYSTGAPLAIDNVNVTQMSGCIALEDLIIRINPNDVNVSWAQSDTATYNVKVSTTQLTNPATSAGNVVDTTINTNSINFGGLAPAATYYVYVQVVCPDETKPYFEKSFTTPCAPINFYVEDFETYDGNVVPNCWNVIGTSVTTTSSTRVKGTCSFRFNGNEQWVVLPAMAADIHEVAAEFDYMIESLTQSGTLTIGVMSDPTDVSTFEEVQTLTASAVSVWDHANISFANTTLTGTGLYVAFHQVATSNYWWWIDDISVGEYRSCEQPTNVAATNITTDGALVSWSADNTAEYTVVIATNQVNPDSVDENTPGVVHYISEHNTNSIDLAGELSMNTRYYVYVQANCGSGKPSFWSQEYNFFTSCSAITIPYVNNFNGNQLTPNLPPSCWTVNTEMNGTVVGEYVSSAYGVVATGNDTCFSMKAYYSTPNHSKVCAALPNIIGSYDTLQLSFRHKGNNAGTLLIGFMSDPSDLSTFHTIDTARFVSTWKSQKVALRGYNNDGEYIAFMLDGDQNIASKTCYIDDIVITGVTACQEPLNITATSTTGEEATITLKTLSAADQNVQVRVATTLANGDSNIDAITNFVIDTIVSVANLPLHITGLNPLTQYYVYARVACGGTSYSPYGEVVGFTTPCGNFSVPFVQSFNIGVQTNGLPQCWTNPDAGVSPKVSKLRGSDDSYSLVWDTVGTVVLPNLNVTSMQALTVYFKLYSQTQNIVEVGVMSDPASTLTFQVIDTCRLTSSASWEEFSVDLASYTGTGGQLAFRSNGVVNLDELYVDYTSTCVRPSNLRATNPTTTSIDLAWHANGNETSWEVVVVPNGTNPAAGTVVAATDTTITVNNLSAGSGYAAYVRAVCGTNNVSSWSSVALFRTQRIAATIPYVCDFEDAIENNRWEFKNDDNGWYIGNAAAHNSNNGMFISNDQGGTNAYTVTSTSLSIAYRYLHFEGGSYMYSYDWRNVGETGFDFIRVFLAPGNTDMTTVTNPGSTLTPTGWIALDHQALDTKSTWQKANDMVAVAEGDYFLVVLWRNDYAAGTNPPGAIDNISIVTPECYLTALTLSPADSSIVVGAITDSPTGDIMVYDNANTATATPIVNVTNVSLPYTVTGLQPQTTYYLSVRGLCTSGDTTEWVQDSTITSCAAIVLNDTTPFVEGFETTTVGLMPECWTSLTNNPTNAPIVSTSQAKTGTKSLYIYGSSSTYGYAISPLFGVDSLQNYRLNFSCSATTYDSELHIGVMSNPSDVSTFVKLASVTTLYNTWTDFQINLNAYTGDGKYIAFRRGVADNGYFGSFYIDDISIEPLPDCLEPMSIATTNLGAHSADLVITPAKATDTSWYVKVSNSAMTNMAATGTILDTVINTTTFSVSNLAVATTYYVYVSTNCGADTSAWTSYQFTTNCEDYTIPFAEGFGTTSVLPSCWNKYYGLLSDAFTGTAPTATVGGWYVARSGNVWTNAHAYSNVYGSDTKCWLVTPNIIIDTTAILGFDVALTKYNSIDPIANVNNQPDDRFVVLVSRDGGASWNANDILAEWGSTTGTRSYSNIATTGEHIELPLSQYIGETIRVAFYAESTTSNGDNDLHINNVTVDRILATIDLTDFVCDGFNYANHGFTLTSDEIAASTDKEFSRMSGDTLYTLTLTINPSLETVFNDTICSGETYSDNGFSTTTAGTYHRYLTSQNGCDSIITLNLVVNQGYTSTETDTICQSQLPYTWKGQTCTQAGVYTHRVAGTADCDSVYTLNLVVTTAKTSTTNAAICQGESYTWNGQTYSTAGTYTWTGTTANGCDSIATLILTVNPVYNVTENKTILDTDLPYTYGDTVFDAGTRSGVYVFNHQTEAGCDSIITLNLSVTAVGLNYAEDGLFAITPNPAHRGEVVRIDLNLPSAEREGLVVELFSNSGALIERFEPKENPIYVTMPQADGLYLVRVTLANGQVMYGKVIVK